MSRKQKLTATVVAGGTKPEYVDFDGVHLTLTGLTAFCYRGFRILNGEEYAKKEMIDTLMQLKELEQLRIELKREQATTNNLLSISAQMGA